MASPADIERVTELLGRSPQGDFEVVVRSTSGDPIVVQNAPLLFDGTPMPTLFWLVGKKEYVAVARLESTGGVDQSEADIPEEEIAAAHQRYKALRDSLLPPHHTGPAPSGGVAGTRRGVKCLHAHYAWFLAGGDDPVGDWVAEKLSLSRSSYIRAAAQPVAAIDIGTNSTNLLIADAQGNDIVREVHVTGLGRGVVHDNTLNEDAIARTIARLQHYATLIKQHEVGTIRVTATEACRRATNAAVFLDQAEAVLGTRPLIIAGTEEGRLAYSGALSHLPAHQGITLVVDIGGGSTEIMIGEQTLHHAVSFPVGTVVLTESHLHHDPPRPEELTNAIGFVTDFMDDLIRDHPEVLNATRVVGVAGSIVTIAAVEIGLQEFDANALHGARMTRENVEEVFRTLATETLADRKFNPGLPADRADVIVGGCCVLVGVMRKLRIPEIMVSVNNLLDGLVRDELKLS